jgi:hypothetical protein
LSPLPLPSSPSPSSRKTKHLAISEQQQQQNSLNDPLLDRKIEDVTAGLIPCYSNLLRKVALSNIDNALTIISYINAMRTEANLSDHYRMDLIRLLSTLSNHFQNKLSFKQKQMTRDNLLAFLNSFRKPESVDPLHKWIGTYNINRIHLSRFFKWLYSPEIEPNKRPKPSVIDNQKAILF